MKRVMVLGSGYMGSGIAQVCANSGYEVLLWDMTEELARKGVKKIAAGLDALYQQTGEERWKAIDRVRALVAAGELGQKSGKGWYDYTSGAKTVRTDL